jgi:hypothetical protein
MGYHILKWGKRKKIKRNNNRSFPVKRLYKTKTTAIDGGFFIEYIIFNSPGFEEGYWD